MTKLETLNELEQLKDSGFGRPYPRHGLKLLHWFAHDCVHFNDFNNMCCLYDPEDREFGFHRFMNRTEENGKKLLPDVDLNYYEVGNLSRPQADDLPDSVLGDYNLNPDHRHTNVDRIVVSVDEECIERVYVTEHTDGQGGFDREATRRISRGLIMIIRELSLEEFLIQMGYFTQQRRRRRRRRR